MPLLHIVIPSNVMIYNEILNSAINFDVFAFIKPWELLPIKYDEKGGSAA